jgi:hypothetical protein
MGSWLASEMIEVESWGSHGLMLSIFLRKESNNGKPRHSSGD